MPLWGYDILEGGMYSPIDRLFCQCYSRGRGRSLVYVKRPYAETNDQVDYVYYRAYNEIHIVEAKRFVSYIDIYDAISKLNRYRGNFKYLALPDGDYYQGQDYVNSMIDGRFGLILVGLIGRGLHAEFFSDSPRYDGDFSRYYVL